MKNTPQIEAEARLHGFTWTQPKEKDGNLVSAGFLTLKLSHQSGRVDRFIEGLLKCAGAVCVVEMLCTPPAPVLFEEGQEELYKGQQPPVPAPFQWAGHGTFGKISIDDPKSPTDPRQVNVPFALVADTAEAVMALVGFRLEMAEVATNKVALKVRLLQPKLCEE